MQKLGAPIVEHIVDRVEPASDGFRMFSKGGDVRAKRLCSPRHRQCATRSNGGLNIPVRPQRGQIIVTEKTQPFLRYRRDDPPDRRGRRTAR